MTALAVKAPLTEAQWQSRVVDYARLRQWRVWHDSDSRRNAAGWPDLVLLRRGRLIMAELKTERGRLRPEQVEWLDELALVPGVLTFLWRPSDWNDVLRVLA